MTRSGIDSRTTFRSVDKQAGMDRLRASSEAGEQQFQSSFETDGIRAQTSCSSDLAASYLPLSLTNEWIAP